MVDATTLRTISRNDLAILGAGDVAYIRAADIQGETVYAIMAGDGRQLGLAPDFDSARAAALQNELNLVSVH
jgi:hypothetical protein